GASAPELSADGLTMFFAAERPGGFGSADIWFSTRASVGDPWSDPVNAGPNVNSVGIEWQPDIAADGRTLYFSRVGDVADHPDYDLWRAQIVPEPSAVVLAVFVAACLGSCIRNGVLRHRCLTESCGGDRCPQAPRATRADDSLYAS
ncbi:MAG: hypothetical protein AAF961_13975, partial [Planctomycetota bacterium]